VLTEGREQHGVLKNRALASAIGYLQYRHYLPVVQVNIESAQAPAEVQGRPFDDVIRAAKMKWRANQAGILRQRGYPEARWFAPQRLNWKRLTVTGDEVIAAQMVSSALQPVVRAVPGHLQR